MTKSTANISLFDRPLLQQALVDAVRKLSPRQQWQNPVMLVVYLGSLLTTLLWLQALAGAGGLHLGHHALAVVHRAVRQFRRSGG